MANFTGKNFDKIVTPHFVSPTLTATGGALASKAPHVIHGTDGDDRITGGNGDDILIGGDGNDTIVGGPGNDLARMGDGDDVFIWNPGDGSDVVEGQAGFDTLDFRGAGASENVSISANGQRATFFRDPVSITMDLHGVERIQFEALGGSDNIVVNDLTGTDVKQVAIDLAAVAGTTTGDGQADTVTVNATAGADNVSVASSGASVVVKGLSEQVTIDGAEAAKDSVVINGLDGNDTIDASALNAGQIKLVIDGGVGNDTIVGSRGADMLIGGIGDDVVTGGVGTDSAFLGDGGDVFIWNPGDGSDVVEGQAGFDTLDFRGAGASENVSISANGERATFFRDPVSITMDLHGVERIQFEALGGSDNIVVNDLTGTDVKQVAIDLAAVAGTTTGDDQADTVTVNATAGADNVSVASSGASVVVKGLSEQVTIDGAEAAKDSVVINGLDGNDTIDASALNAGQIKLVIDGGVGNDTIVGSRGDDVLIGGAGNDEFVFTSGESGHDTIVGFQAHGANTQGDVVALAGFSDHTFDQAIADGHIAQAGADVVISDGTNIVATLQNISLTSLHANDFLFT